MGRRQTCPAGQAASLKVSLSSPYSFPVLLFHIAFSSSSVLVTTFDRLNGRDDGYINPSVHSFTISGRDGLTAVMGYLVETHGQGGPAPVYCGLFKKRKFVQRTIKKRKSSAQ